MTGGVPSEPAEGTQYGELPEYEGDTEFDVSRPQSCKLNIRFQYFWACELVVFWILTISTYAHTFF